MRRDQLEHAIRAACQSLVAHHPVEGLCINWERASVEDHGQLGGDLL